MAPQCSAFGTSQRITLGLRAWMRREWRRRNVAVDLAMNQKDRNFGACDRIFWRDLLHVEAVLPASIEKREFDDGAEESASEPRAEVKGLAHAVIGDLAKAGEGRFCGDGAEARLDSERL